MRKFFGLVSCIALGLCWAPHAAATPGASCTVDTPSLACTNARHLADNSRNSVRFRAVSAGQQAAASDQTNGRTNAVSGNTFPDAAEPIIGLPFNRWGLWAAGMRTRFDGRIAVRGYDQLAENSLRTGGQWNAGAFVLGAARIDEQRAPSMLYERGFQPAVSASAVTFVGSYPLGDAVSIDLAAARTRLTTGTYRFDSEPLAGTPLGLRSGYDVGRLLWSLSLSASREIGAFGISGRVGYLGTREQFDSQFNAGESSVRLGSERAQFLRQSFVGVDASYDFSRSWRLHGAAVLRRDLSSSDSRVGMGFANAFGVLPSAERDEREWVVGVRYYGWRNFALNVEFLKTSGRDQFGGETLSFIGRIGF